MIDGWLNGANLVQLALACFLCMAVASAAAYALRRWQRRISAPAKTDDESGGLEGYVVSSVFGLLALLLGFTYALAVDRYEIRRGLVLEEANTIGTAHLHAQLLDEPHRTRLSGILVNYAENRIVLATADPDKVPPLLAKSDALLIDLGAATAAAFDSIRNIDFSTAMVDSMNNVIVDDAARKAARLAHVPTQIYVVLFIYMCISAGVLGYVITRMRHFIAIAVLFMLLTLAVMLIIDIDRPKAGTIKESQGAMERLVVSLRQRQGGDFDRWRIAPRPAE